MTNLDSNAYGWPNTPMTLKQWHDWVHVPEQRDAWVMWHMRRLNDPKMTRDEQIRWRDMMALGYIRIP